MCCASEPLRFRRREKGLLGIAIAHPIVAAQVTRQMQRLGEEARMRERGITLLQLVVGAAVVAVLAAISLPAFFLAMQNFRFRGAVDQVVGDLRRARSLAVTRGPYEAGFHVSDSPRQYRVELRCTSGCPSLLWPADADTPASNANVITMWQNISTLYLGVTVSRPVGADSNPLDRIIFNSLGNSVATTLQNHPISITISKAVGTPQVVQVAAIGSVEKP